jgi:hypothetical protein
MSIMIAQLKRLIGEIVHRDYRGFVLHPLRADELRRRAWRVLDAFR